MPDDPIGFPVSYSIGFLLSYYLPNIGIDIDILPITNYESLTGNINIYIKY